MAIAPTPHEINKAVTFISDSLRYPFVHSEYPMGLPAAQAQARWIPRIVKY